MCIATEVRALSCVLWNLLNDTATDMYIYTFLYIQMGVNRFINGIIVLDICYSLACKRQD